MKSFELVLEKSEWLCANIKYFVFRRTDGLPLQFIPGQFITLNISDGANILERQYSLSRPSLGLEWDIEIGVTVSAQGTR